MLDTLLIDLVSPDDKVREIAHNSLQSKVIQPEDIPTCLNGINKIKTSQSKYAGEAFFQVITKLQEEDIDEWIPALEKSYDFLAAYPEWNADMLLFLADIDTGLIAPIQNLLKNPLAAPVHAEAAYFFGEISRKPNVKKVLYNDIIPLLNDSIWGYSAFKFFLWEADAGWIA